jgi:hypothetical protein
MSDELQEIRVRLQELAAEEKRLKRRRTELLIPQCQAAEGKCFVRYPSKWESPCPEEHPIYWKLVHVVILNGDEGPRVTFFVTEVDTFRNCIKQEWAGENILDDDYRTECSIGEYDAALLSVLIELRTARGRVASLNRGKSSK